MSYSLLTKHQDLHSSNLGLRCHSYNECIHIDFHIYACKIFLLKHVKMITIIIVSPETCHTNKQLCIDLEVHHPTWRHIKHNMCFCSLEPFRDMLRSLKVVLNVKCKSLYLYTNIISLYDPLSLYR
jgi:hypothetical protein